MLIHVSQAVTKAGLRVAGRARGHSLAGGRCMRFRRRAAGGGAERDVVRGGQAHRRQRGSAHRALRVSRRGRGLHLGGAGGGAGGSGGRRAGGPVGEDGDSRPDRRASARRVDEREGRLAQPRQLHAGEPHRASRAVGVSRGGGDHEPGARVRRGAGVRPAGCGDPRGGALPDVGPGHRGRPDGGSPAAVPPRDPPWGAHRGRGARGGRGAARARGGSRQDLGRRPGRRRPQARAARVPGDHRRGATPAACG